MDVSKQLEEIQILQCSLIPPELFAFILPEEDLQEWTRLLEDYNEDSRIPDDDDWQPASTCRFEIRVRNVPIWFEVELPREYPEQAKPIIYVRGADLQRGEQERWQAIIRERLHDLKEEGADFVVQNLLCMHLIPLLHEEARCALRSNSTPSAQPPTISTSSETHHVLFTSHHLISPTKRRNLQKWTSELSLRGFAKVGYPGVIYAEGAQADIEEFVGRVKAMQWLALKVRFEERLDTEKYGRLRLGEESQNAEYEQDRGVKVRWMELEKVGEVVETMRRSGREEFVTEMGLGSTGVNNSSTIKS